MSRRDVELAYGWIKYFHLMWAEAKEIELT